MARTTKPVNQKCQWIEDDDGNWDTQCGDKFTFNDGGPVANGFRFCAYCGLRLEQVWCGQRLLESTQDSDAVARGSAR
jgi:hypothetical protein